MPRGVVGRREPGPPPDHRAGLSWIPKCGGRTWEAAARHRAWRQMPRGSAARACQSLLVVTQLLLDGGAAVPAPEAGTAIQDGAKPRDPRGRTQVEQRGGGSEEEEGVWPGLPDSGAGSGAWWRGGRGGDKVGVRRSCPPQARLGNPVNHRRPSPSAGADRRVEAGFVISLPLVPSSFHFPPWMGLDMLPAPQVRIFPRTSECDFNWIWGLYGGDQVKMMSSWGR